MIYLEDNLKENNMDKNQNSMIIPVVISLILVFGLAIGIFVFLNKEGSSLPNTVVQDNINLEESNMTNIEDFSELEIAILKEGAGVEATAGNIVSVHYVGTLSNGSKFDSSRDRGEPFSFTLGEGRVIEGWEQGVLGMKIGEVRELKIPSAMGYGEYGSGPIPGNAGLIFEVELLEIN